MQSIYCTWVERCAVIILSCASKYWIIERMKLGIQLVYQLGRLQSDRRHLAFNPGSSRTTSFPAAAHSVLAEETTSRHGRRDSAMTSAWSSVGKGVTGDLQLTTIPGFRLAQAMAFWKSLRKNFLVLFPSECILYMYLRFWPFFTCSKILIMINTTLYRWL